MTAPTGTFGSFATRLGGSGPEPVSSDGAHGGSKVSPAIGRVLRLVEVAAVVALIGFALSLRLGDLDGARSNFPDLFDEGIRAEQLLLMSHGFRPYRDIYASQGPLLLDIMYPLASVLGGTLGGARLAVGLISLVGILGAYWSAREAAGPFAGLLAAVILVANPLYLEGSRLALAEVPSLAPALLALPAGLRYQRVGSRRWLVLAALLLSIAVLIKPMVIGATVPVAAAVLLRPRARPADMALFVAVGLGFAALVILMLGPADVYQQIVDYRVSSRASSGWDPAKNLEEVVLAPARSRPALANMGALGALAALVLGRRGVPISLWLLASYAVLFLYTPLHPKHQVYLVPPLALAGSVGLVALLRLRSGALVRLGGLVGALLMTVQIAALLSLAPAALARGVALVDDEVDADLHVYDREVAATLRAAVPEQGFALSDHPFLAYLAGRMVPPEMVDPSKGRFRAGVLTSELAIESAERRDVVAVLFWADRFRRLTAFAQWVQDRYLPVHILGPRILRTRDGKDRSVYVPMNSDLEGLHARVAADLPIAVNARYANDFVLESARISTAEVSPGSGFAVTLLWRALRSAPPDYSMMVSLIDDRGEAWAAQQLELDGTDRGGNIWTEGRWLLRSAMLTPEDGIPPGVYRVVVALEDSRIGSAVVELGRNSAESVNAVSTDRLSIGTLPVRPNG